MTLSAGLATAPAADEQASVVFGKLSNGMQRYHADNITAAKRAATGQRHIDKGQGPGPGRQAKVTRPLIRQNRTSVDRWAMSSADTDHSVRHNTGYPSRRARLPTMSANLFRMPQARLITERDI